MKQTGKTKSSSSRRGHIVIHRNVCKGCSLCLSVCPRQVIAISGILNDKGYYPAEFLATEQSGDDRHCTACSSCAIICPDVAIEVYRD